MQQEANSNNELFEEQRTLDVLNGMPKDTNQEEILKGVRSAIDTFVKGAPQFDDITMIGFKYFGKEGKG